MVAGGFGRLLTLSAGLCGLCAAAGEPVEPGADWLPTLRSELQQCCGPLRRLGTSTFELADAPPSTERRSAAARFRSPQAGFGDPLDVAVRLDRPTQAWLRPGRENASVGATPSRQLLRVTVSADEAVDVTLDFLVASTETPARASKALLYVFGIDQDGDLLARASSQGFQSSSVSPSTSLSRQRNATSGHWWFAAGASSAPGDAPAGLDGLTATQLDRAAVFEFEAVDSVGVRLQVTCELCTPGSSHDFFLALEVCVSCRSSKPVRAPEQLGSTWEEDLLLADTVGPGAGASPYGAGMSPAGRGMDPAGMAAVGGAAAPVGAVPHPADVANPLDLTGQKAWRVRGHSLCTGQEQQWADCGPLPDCHVCQPSHCVLSEWGEWKDLGGCSGLCYRRRGIKTPNNACGRPCRGDEEMTKECPKPECLPKAPANCNLTEWSGWGPCSEMQQQRTRRVCQESENGGMPCGGTLREVRACDVPNARDCELSEWSAWTSCSASCGGGYHDRVRRPIRFAENGGRPCEGTLRQVAPCGERSCGGPAPVPGPWTQWAGCDSASPLQRFRDRKFIDGVAGSDDFLVGAMRETTDCHSPPRARDCELTEWSDWQACDQTCGRQGQTYRRREVKSQASVGGRCSAAVLRQAKPCDLQPCDDGDCRMSEWCSWSPCSSDSGDGLKKRKREVLNPGGSQKGCTGHIEEVRSCVAEGPEDAVDCQWNSWDAWSACTCSCGGGTKRRTRSVRRSPARGGQLCDPVRKAEIAPCNVQVCSKSCVDGEWDHWSTWTPCSASCGQGFKWRHRDVARQASDCGAAAVGKAQEWALCQGIASGDVCGDRDCQLSSWGSWSDCSCTCFGVRERNRIVQQFSGGRGKSCVDMDLKQIEPCNPTEDESAPVGCLTPPSDCAMDLWSEWSSCPVTCGGGNRFRTRSLTPSANQGKACKPGVLRETEPCNEKVCQDSTCIDCLWGSWSEWGDCSKCGGQRYRNRAIERLPNHCGRRCEARPAKEISNCSSHCTPKHYCGWKEWTSWSGCSAECGSATRMRQRSLFHSTEKPLDPLFEVDLSDGGATCVGTQVDLEQCFPIRACTPPCVPKDCELGPWSPWEQPTCTGLCERSRVIEHVNNECGKACAGTLVDTKKCTTKLGCTITQDCKFSDWHEWQQADTHDDVGNVYRTRSVLQMPANGGQECVGALREVQALSVFESPSTPCQMQDWEEWSQCTRTCGGGWTERVRRIGALAIGGGEVCDAPLSEGEPCATEPCPAADCLVGSWDAWSACTSENQMSRRRQIEQFATGAGASCGAGGSPLPLDESMACGRPKADCVVSDWTEFDDCDRSCGGGQQQRHRQILVNPAGGAPCPTNLRELRGCSSGQCNTIDCQLSEWDDWSSCPVTCGTAQQSRNRQVISPAQGNGRPCEGGLTETRNCMSDNGKLLPCAKNDCLWHSWSSWSGCSCSCGGGQKTRNRGIQQMPAEGGAMCTAQSREEVMPCNEQSCDSLKCQDGMWSEWGPWSICSSSCGGGTTYRHRSLAREANQCGKPAEGYTIETSPCNRYTPCGPDVDCKFAHWGEWSECTRTCDGIKRRSRGIAQHGRGDGKWCLGAAKETAPCNPSPGEQPPGGCLRLPTDCALSPWSEWSMCAVTCGTGQSRRERDILEVARLGGHGCNDDLVQTKACGTANCLTTKTPIDCKWSQWSSWGACSKCGGQRTRFRQVEQESRNGGHACHADAAEEMDDCPRRCHEAMFCVWNSWSPWGACSEVCGTGGKRSRSRHLSLKYLAQVKEMGMIAESEVLGAPASLAEEEGGPAGWARFASPGLRFELLVAFFLGYLGRAVLLTGESAWRQRGSATARAAPSLDVFAGQSAPAASAPRGLLTSWLSERRAETGGYLPVATQPPLLDVEA